MCLQCLLDQLLLSRDEQGKGMSKAALRDELMTLLVAGQETSAILLGWTCAFLAQHSEAQRRAADEAKAVRSLQLCSYILLKTLLVAGRETSAIRLVGAAP